MNAINKAVKRLGLAGLGGIFTKPISAQAVHKWVQTGVVPIDRCPTIELAMQGETPCEELREDISWVRVPDPSWPHPQGRPLVDYSTVRETV